MSPRPPIPASLKRSLRQRCGFGCVICGCPVFDYEHIDGFGVTGHDPDRMTLLCPTHHREKTAGRLSAGRVAKHNLDPFNSRQSFTAGHPLFFDPDVPLQLQLGNTGFVPVSRDTSMVGIAVDGDFALAVGLSSTGHPVVDIDVRDLDDKGILRVTRGQLRAATSTWDVDFVGTRLHLRESARNTIIDIHFDAPNGIVDVRSANFALHQVPILIGRHASRGGLELPASGNEFAGLLFEGGVIAIGEPVPPRWRAYQLERRMLTAFGSVNPTGRTKTPPASP